jgi:hypothetical protein
MRESTGFPAELDDGFFRRLVTRAHFELWRAGAGGGLDPLDVAEEALVDLYRLWSRGALETTDPTALLRGLAATIVRRRALDAARAERARRERPARHPSGSLEGTAAALDLFRREASSTTRRLRRIDARERVRAILDYVARREGRDRRAAGDYELLVLRRIEERSFEEIAAMRGRRESADGLRSRLRRLEARIRERFPRDGR